MSDIDSDIDFDTALITAAFRIAGHDGWHRLSVVAAAREAGLPLPAVRARFPSRAAILLRFGSLADQEALRGAPPDGSSKDRLFDLLMRRFDVMQANRAGVKALLRALPVDPPLALLLACATRRSMRWMLEAAGISGAGPRGELRVKGLMGVWLWTLRAWDKDESEDLSGTMSALDHALHRAEQIEATFGARVPGAPSPPPVSSGGEELDPPEPPAGVTELAVAGTPDPEAPSADPGAAVDQSDPPGPTQTPR